MKNLVRLSLVVVLLGFGTPFAPTAEAADSFGNFLKRVGNTLAKPFRPPDKKVPAKSPKRSRRKAPDATQETQESVDPSEPEPIHTPTPPPAPEIRLARPAPGDPTGRRDPPYGVPVPGRPGFVHSPFAPRQRLVDVRAFPSGTPVVDPYTGRVFLTP
ncbi:MAG: hypothetical protein H0V56_02980 [Chthoniobacterales bacterium]|nr:hypothetical protein [Chthoniobacterales bacterium]